MRLHRSRLRKMVAIILAAASCLTLAQPVLSVVTREFLAAPRETITIMAQLENTSDKAMPASVGVVTAAGWRLLLPLPQVSLAAGETRLLPLPILVPPDAPAGEHELLITAATPETNISQTVTITVTHVQKVEAQVDHAPTDSLPEPYEVTFQLTNRGNQQESIRLAVQSNQRLTVTPEPPNLDLEPGESALVKVAVPALTGLERPTRHVLSLTATPMDGEPVRVTSSTNVIAIAQPARLAYHTFPIRLGLTVGNGKTDAFGVRRIEARGRGQLREGSNTNVSFHVRHSPLSNERRYELTLNNPTWTIHLAKQKNSLGQLLPAAEGTGASLHLRTDYLNASLHGLSTRNGPQAGFSITPPPLRGATFTARGTFSTKHAIMSLHGLFPAQLPNHRHFTLELEPAIDLLSGAPAMHIQGTSTGPDYRLSANFTHTSDGHNNMTGSRADFSVNARVLLLPSLSVEARYEGSTNTERVTGKADLNVQATTGPLRWGVRYKHHMDSLESAPKNEHNAAFSVRVIPAPRSSLATLITWTSHLAPDDQPARDLLRLELGGVTPLGTGTISGTIKAEYDLTDEQITTALLGAAWHGPLTTQTSLDLALDHDLTGNRTTHFKTGVTHDFRNGARANGKLDARTSIHTPLSVTAELGFEIPIELRLARKAGVTEVHGTLLDSNGTGLSRHVISLAGFTALTNEDGTYHFPAIPAGEHTLFINGLAPALTTEPALPLRVNVPQAEPLTITAFESATVQGTIHLQQADQGSTSRGIVEANTGAKATTTHNAGIRLRFTNETSQRNAVTNSQGHFEMTGLTPGTWHVMVDAASIPDGYEARGNTLPINLSPGETTQLDLEITPVKREIRFTGGGDLGD